MDHDDMDYDDYLDWLANPPRPDTPPSCDEEAFAEFERADTVASKIKSTDEFKSGEVVLISCPICSTPCMAEGGHGLSCLSCGHSFHYSCINRRLKEEKECPICQNTAGEEDIIRVKLFSASENEDLSGALASMCLNTSRVEGTP